MFSKLSIVVASVLITLAAAIPTGTPPPPVTPPSSPQCCDRVVPPSDSTASAIAGLLGIDLTGLDSDVPVGLQCNNWFDGMCESTIFNCDAPLEQWGVGEGATGNDTQSSMYTRKAVPATAKKGTDTAASSTDKAHAKAGATKKSTAHSAAALSRTLSSLSSTELAPSDTELYKLAGLIFPAKKESAGEFRGRAVENERSVATWMLALKKGLGEVEKGLGEVEKAHTDHAKQITHRLSDMQLASPAASASLSLNTTTDIARLKKVALEGRESISKLTECLNGLVDLPGELASVKRMLKDLATRPAAAPTSSAHSSHTHPAAKGTKRARDFSPEHNAPAKHHKAGQSDTFDAYMWDVDLGKGSATSIAKKALSEAGIDHNVFISAIHPKNMPKGLISIRFANSVVGRRFLDRLRANPPRGMEHLHVASAANYGKRRDESDNVLMPKDHN
ncbi:hypothetical protein B0H13DRAFT_2538739 [Mycena leptocephala]|nr:hypothetical protein B0H13DRAFT_2538739 [Mycena leptocephala]